MRFPSLDLRAISDSQVERADAVFRRSFGTLAAHKLSVVRRFPQVVAAMALPLVERCAAVSGWRFGTLGVSWLSIAFWLPCA